MKFTLFTAAVAAVTGVVNAASSSAKVTSSGSTVPKFAETTPNIVNPSANLLCINYGLAIPPCGTTALVSLASSINGCGLLDFDCQCAVSDQVQALASSPIIATCGLDTALVVQGAADQLCSCVRANNAPLTATGPPASATGAAAPGVGRAKATGIFGSIAALGGALAAGAGVVAAL